MGDIVKKTKGLSAKVPEKLANKFKALLSERGEKYYVWLIRRIQNSIDNGVSVSSVDTFAMDNNFKKVYGKVPEDLADKLKILLIMNKTRFDLWLINEMMKEIDENNKNELARFQALLAHEHGGGLQEE